MYTMSEQNYSPYVLLLLDSILLFAVCHQAIRRCRLARKFRDVMADSEESDSSIRRKAWYRAILALLLFLKCLHSVGWLIFQGWGHLQIVDANSYRPFFWALYGAVMAIAMLLKGDFAAVLMILAYEGKRKARWRMIIRVASIMGVIFTLWGVVLSIGIPYAPIWQYLAFLSAILSSFITYKMTMVIIHGFSKARESTMHIQSSVTDAEFEKQLYQLFTMKQIIFALIFIALYAVFAFLSNLADMFKGDAIDYPFVGEVHWYLQLKLIMFNFYLYALITIFLIYCRESTSNPSAQLEQNLKLQDNLTTPISPTNLDDDVVIIMYPPSLDPTVETASSNSMDTASASSGVLNRNPTFTGNGSSNGNIGGIPNLPGIARPSPREGVAVHTRSDSASLFMSPRQTSTLDVFPVFGNNISIGSAEDICKEINMTDVSAGIYVAPQMDSTVSNSLAGGSLVHPGMSRSVSAERIDVDVAHKKASMFDIDIASLKEGGAPLERIYFDCQKARGLSSKSLMLAAKMSKESHCFGSTTGSEAGTSDRSEEEAVNKLNTESLCYPPSEISTEAIKVIVPENGVLTPLKDTNHDPNSLKMTVKSPGSTDVEDLSVTTNKSPNELVPPSAPIPRHAKLGVIGNEKKTTVEMGNVADDHNDNDNNNNDNDNSDEFHTPDDDFPPRDGHVSRPSQQFRVHSQSPY